ncbi:unnamed protein product [Sphenostylis stenocarpa]|uniref:Uncharacterized protein n=1 Tax=Sphenostylis stenocarpa TaxID=92480 RepID=A0AA86VPS5_9FABA|nr:unnamed protein product [Sphenostylis stenocarpa]
MQDKDRLNCIDRVRTQFLVAREEIAMMVHVVRRRGLIHIIDTSLELAFAEDVESVAQSSKTRESCVFVLKFSNVTYVSGA